MVTRHTCSALSKEHSRFVPSNQNMYLVYLGRLCSAVGWTTYYFIVMEELWVEATTCCATQSALIKLHSRLSLLTKCICICIDIPGTWCTLTE